jgi:hypothetical protein
LQDIILHCHLHQLVRCLAKVPFQLWALQHRFEAALGIDALLFKLLQPKFLDEVAILLHPELVLHHLTYQQ